MSPCAVGIDLGTANSLLAYVHAGGHSEMLRDREGKLHIPSVVLFDDDRVIVGEEARLRGRNMPSRLAACAKLDMGKRFYTQPIGDQHLAPEVIQACILRQLKLEITQRVGGDFGAVIGVPAFFNDLQRRATVEAAEMAGLRLLDVLNEPVAAALAFGEHAPAHLSQGESTAGSHVLVFDLGGYTFESTLLRCEGESFATLATERDNHLGGTDWDRQLAEHLAEQFQTQYAIDLNANPADLDRLFALAIRAKVALGMRPTTTVTIPRAGEPQSVTISRKDFEGLTAELLDRTRAHTEKTLASAGVAWTDLSRILLVGGATRMPMIGRMLLERSGRMPDQRVSPDEAVCRGASIFAAHLLDQQGRGRAPRNMKIANISTHSLGIEGTDLASGKKINRVLIPRGTPLPAKATREFVTKANDQRSVSITVLEGDGTQPQQCVTIGRAVLRELPSDLTTQWPIEVTCEYGASGRLTIDARVRYTDRTVRLELTRPGGVSQTHLDRWKTAVDKGAGFSVFQELADRERQEEAPPPIARVVSPPKVSEEEGRILSFLHRYLPFMIRGAEKPGSTHDQ